MKNLVKLIAIVTMTTLLVCLMMTFATADEKIYTSPAFKLPKDRLSQWLEAQVEESEEEDEPTEAAEPTEEGTEPAEEGTEPAEVTKPAEEGTEPAEVTEPTEEGTEPAEMTEPAEEGTEPAEVTEPTEEGIEPTEVTEPTEGTQPAEEGTEPAETTEPTEEGTAPADVTEPTEEGTELAEPAEPTPVERQVLIHSSQRKVVEEGELIYLTSELIGFDGVTVSYQWQVDRGDGLGWVDIPGATSSIYRYVADKETVKYFWRLFVTIDE